MLSPKADVKVSRCCGVYRSYFSFYLPQTSRHGSISRPRAGAIYLCPRDRRPMTEAGRENTAGRPGVIGGASTSSERHTSRIGVGGTSQSVRKTTPPTDIYPGQMSVAGRGCRPQRTYRDRNRHLCAISAHLAGHPIQYTNSRARRPTPTHVSRTCHVRRNNTAPEMATTCRQPDSLNLVPARPKRTAGRVAKYRVTVIRC